MRITILKTVVLFLFGLSLTGAATARSIPGVPWPAQPITLDPPSVSLVAPPHDFPIVWPHQTWLYDFAWRPHWMGGMSYPILPSLSIGLPDKYRNFPPGLREAERRRRTPERLRGIGKIVVYKIEYHLCIFETARCDQTGQGRQDLYGPVREPRRSMTLAFTASEWQGRQFQWAVRACTTFANLNLPKKDALMGPFCRWSPSQQVSWLLSPPFTLSTARDETRYGELWHLLLNWGEVTGADFYEVCIARSLFDLNQECVAYDTSGPTVFEKKESKSPLEVLGTPAIGNNGDTVFWKVAACSESLESPYKCTYSAPETLVWPP